MAEQPVDGLAQRQRRHQRGQAALPEEGADRGQQHAAAEMAGAALQRMQYDQRADANGHDGVSAFAQA